MKQIILLFALTSFCMHSFSQHEHKALENHNLIVKGKIMEGNKYLKDATVILYKNDKVLNQIDSPKGSFEFTLSYDESYILEFSKKGYVSKKLEINTNNVSFTEGKYGYEYSFGVKLFKEQEGTDYSNFEDPVASILYCECADKFVYKKR